MIKRLLVKNLAIIQELEVTFNPGLNMITGETGSGKSILIEAIGLLTGGRADGDIIRTGEDVAVVEGELTDGDDTWLIRRVLKAGGASRIYVNEEPAKLTDLEALTSQLIDLHGQHEHQSLLRVTTHIDFLDAYAGLLPDREVLAHTYQRLVRLNAELKQLTTQVVKEKDLHELHQFQLKELEDAELSRQEEEQLKQEHQLLSQADELHHVLIQIEHRLQTDETSLAGELDGLLRHLDRFIHLSPKLGKVSERLASLKVELEDVAYDVGRYRGTVKSDPKRLVEIDDRLGQLEVIKRKFGGTINAALDMLAWLREAVGRYIASDERLAQLQQEQVRQREAYTAQCQELSDQRRPAREKLEREIQDTLARLDMPGTRFEVRIENVPAAGGACVVEGEAYKSDDRGYDQVEFFISPNPGEELRPLAKIASGGEISRTMLGIKTVLAAYDPVYCLVFDEIDSGISGSTAETVGVALKDLARSRQVVCITHLPQIAARGDHHLSMDKYVRKGRTLTRVRVMTGAERRREIARLLSGAEITQPSLDQAEELITQASGSQKELSDG
ncbi:DNA repair protein RecN [Candidatus Neomarinimicrobiota bacterium]